jgi:uncharacterized protein
LSEILIILIYVGVGFFTGILIGMLGIGGGVIFIPTLYYLLPFTGIAESDIPYFAISISLFAGAIAASFSALFHLRRKNVDKKKAILFFLGSGSAAFISVLFVTSVSPQILKIIFAVVLFIIAMKMFFDSQFRREPGRKKQLNNFALPVIGLFVGVLSAFTGLGGGIIFFPVLHYLFLLDTKKAIGTSSVITAGTMILASLSFLINKNSWMEGYQLSSTFLIAAVPLGVGAVIGARVGVNFVLNSKKLAVKKIFSILLIIVVIKIIFGLW